MIGFDSEIDLVLLKINVEYLFVIFVNDSFKLCVGDVVLVIGNLFNLG